MVGIGTFMAAVPSSPVWRIFNPAKTISLLNHDGSVAATAPARSSTTPLEAARRRHAVTALLHGHGFAREFQGQVLTFGVSGKLIMNAVFMYDLETDSLWSQFLAASVDGSFAGTPMELFPSQLTT